MALAGLLDGMKRHTEAETLHRRALPILERRLGNEHSDFGYVLENLAACLHAQGRTAEAEPFARRAVAVKEKSLGPTHPDV